MFVFSIVVAVDLNNGIGLRGDLPWHNKRLSHDMKHFRSLTLGSNASGKRNCVIMGRKTWLSIPPAHRPLPERLNVVVSSRADLLSPDEEEAATVKRVTSLQAALDLAAADESVHAVFVIGGAALYAEALQHAQCRHVHLTRVFAQFECDTFLPRLPARFELDAAFARVAHVEHGVPYEWMTYTAVRGGEHEEHQYLRLIQRILDTGVLRSDRTGVGTLSLFGAQQRWNLRTHFPLLTTKRVFWRGVAEELLWFVRGHTDAKLLQAKDVHIWDGNGTREFLDSRGLTSNAVGDLGPVYGFQWRHFGAAYTTCDADYGGQGVDQLAEIVQTIKKNPSDRRMCLSAWNPSALAQMALPPCHMFAQFYVADGELSCHMYQRSNDMGLGVPFNIASYALLTCMVAHVCGLKPGDLVHSMGDAHVYLTHIEPLREQLQREPRPFPTLRIKRAVSDIDQFQFEDFELLDYAPHASIKMEMAV
jgi:dihydrofolate reductase/thymidylate synthase